MGTRHQELGRAARKAIEAIEPRRRSTGCYSEAGEIGKTRCHRSLESGRRSGQSERSRPEAVDEATLLPLAAQRGVDIVSLQLCGGDNAVLAGGQCRNLAKSVVHCWSVHDGCHSAGGMNRGHRNGRRRPISVPAMVGRGSAAGDDGGGCNHAARHQHRGGAVAGEVASTAARDLEHQRGTAEHFDR